MPMNEEGEFELVLQSKQLLSVFFLIVLLLTVFFSMGFIVGRNTAPVSQMASARSGQATVVEGPAPTPVTPPAADTRPSPTGPATAPSGPPPVRPAPVTPVKPEPKPVEPPKAEPPKTVPVTPPAPAASPVKGSLYLQVAAIREKDAKILSEVLSRRGFSTSFEEVPEKGLVRVLVGPFRDADAINDAREKLRDFKPIQRKM